MFILSGVLFAFAIVLGVFCYWGINTIAGQHAYDEMAAIAPYSAGLASLLLILVAIGLLLWKWRKSGD